MIIVSNFFAGSQRERRELTFMWLLFYMFYKDNVRENKTDWVIHMCFISSIGVRFFGRGWCLWLFLIVGLFLILFFCGVGPYWRGRSI